MVLRQPERKLVFKVFWYSLSLKFKVYLWDNIMVAVKVMYMEQVQYYTYVNTLVLIWCNGLPECVGLYFYSNTSQNKWYYPTNGLNLEAALMIWYFSLFLFCYILLWYILFPLTLVWKHEKLSVVIQKKQL